MKNKVGLILDSSSNVTKKYCDENGIGFIPLIMNINGEEYKSGIDITLDELKDKMKNDKKINLKTSTPIISDIKKEFENILSTNEKAIYIPLSKNFSGTYSAAIKIANEKDFKNKIFVINSIWSSPWTEMYIDKIINIIGNNEKIDEKINSIEIMQKNFVGFLSPDDIYWFYKGGRITKKQYIIGNSLKIYPILKIENGKISEDVIKGISSKTSLNKIVYEVKKELEKIDNKKIEIYIIKDTNLERKKLLKEIILEKLGYKVGEEKELNLSLEQTAHMGPNAFGVAYKVI